MTGLIRDRCRFGQSSRLRVALYSHDTLGMGHMRRNMLIAQTLAGPTVQANVLLMAGAREGSSFAKPPGVDCLTLPALHKDEDGHYRSRCLEISLKELISLRSTILESATKAFSPDLFIVDGVPRGAVGELNETLKFLHAKGDVCCVLGLRDVLDDPCAVRRQWRSAANEDAIRNYYDAVWVYGDPKVYDLAAEYHLSDDIAAKLHYTGYLDCRERLSFSTGEGAELLASLLESGDRIALCMVGGGQDGDRLATVFAAADFPQGMVGVVLMGPYMPAEVRGQLRSQMRSNPRFKALDFVTDPDLILSRADRVVAMGGYNTMLELLCFEKHGLIVPRVKPRREQLIRAQRLRDLGLLELLHPDELSPSTVSQWLARDLGSPPRVRDRIDVNGLTRLPQLLEEVLAASACRLPP